MSFIRPGLALVAAIMVLSAGLPQDGHAQQSPPQMQRPVPQQQRMPGAVNPQIQQRRQYVEVFQRLYDRHRNDPEGLQRALLAERITPLVGRLCLVPGMFGGKVECRPLREMLQRNLQLNPADLAVLDLAFNDLWERLGGSIGGGDILACGGADPLSVTHLLTRSRPVQGAKVTEQSRGVPGRPGLNDSAAMIDQCRGAQTASARAGLGDLYTPGSPGYRRAVQNAQAFLASVGATCEQQQQNPANWGRNQLATDTQDKSTIDGKTVAAGASAAHNFAQGVKASTEVVQHCGAAPNPVGCGAAVYGVVSSLAGVAADADSLNDNPNPALQGASNVGSIVGMVVTIASTSSTAGITLGAIFPVLASLSGGIALGTALEGPLDRAFLKDWHERRADAAWEKKYGSPTAPIRSPGGGGGAPAGQPGMKRPAEDGKPDCKALAAAAERFNAYCSQPGNDWRSYDCMIFVARLNGCADPGLIRPAEGGDYECSAPQSSAAQREAECQRTQKLRDMLSRPGGTGERGVCASPSSMQFDLDQRMRAQLCTRILTDDPNGMCSGVGAPRSRR
jgi:hypothetical protein